MPVVNTPGLLAVSLLFVVTETSTSLLATAPSLLEKRRPVCWEWERWDFRSKAHSSFGGSQLSKHASSHGVCAVIHSRLRGGVSNPAETPEKHPRAGEHAKTGGKKLALSRESEKEESHVHFESEKCKQNTLVMISRNFTTAEWARPFVGLHGKLVSPGEDRGTWHASFGNQSGVFHVGADGISHLAYFDESIPEHHYRLAAALVATHGNASLAKAIFERALAIAPTNVNCLSGYGMLIHSKFHDCARAEEYFKRALELAPQNVDTICNYGAVLLDEFKRDYAGAKRLFDAALAIDPNHVPTRCCLGLMAQEVFKDPAGAERHYLHALSIDPQHTDTMSHFGTFLGKVRMDYYASERVYAQVLRLDPVHVNTICNLGLVRQTLYNDYDGAEGLYDAAIQLDPGHWPSYGFKGLLHHTVRRNYALAEQCYQRALGLNPQDLAVLSNYGHMLHDVRRNGSAAEELFRRALRVDPGHEPALGHLAFLLADRGDFDGAERMYRRMLAVSPDNSAAAVDYSGLLVTARKDFDRAQALLEAARLADPGNGDVVQALQETRRERIKHFQEKPTAAALAARRELERRRLEKTRALARDRGRRSQSVGGQGQQDAEEAARRMAALLLEEEAADAAAAADGLGLEKRSASPPHHPRSRSLPTRRAQSRGGARADAARPRSESGAVR